MNKKGQSTILVIGFLVVLVLMVVVFWVLNKVQGITPSGYIDQFRAKVLAQTGLERAIVEFHNNPYVYFVNNNNPIWFYWGKDLNHTNQAENIECASENALCPSFAAGILENVNGKKIGYSAIISRVRESSADLYILKIIDTSSQIYLNGTGSGTINLLNNLGKTLGIDSNLGNRIIHARQNLPNNSFSVKEELKEILKEKEYKKIEPYVTIWGVPNLKVIKPKSFSERAVPVSLGQDIVRLSQLNPGTLDLEPRVPININTAPKPVLVSAIREIAGWYLGLADVTNPGLEGGDEIPANQFSYEKEPILRIGVIREAKIEDKLAERLAELIIKERLSQPFLSWDEFNKFCGRLLAEGVFGPISTPAQRELSQAKADLLKASANPNTDLNKFNPNPTMARLIDKSDITVHTTEFCFQPQGYFEIESTGIVTRLVPKATEISKRKGEFTISGLKKIRQVLKLFDVYQETTQQDFSRGTMSHSAKGYSSHKNKTLQIYPEPDIEEYSEKCSGDGQIMRATLQNNSRNKEKNELLTFQHHFDNGLKADYSAGKPLPVEETGDTGTEVLFKRPNQQSLFNQTGDGPGSVYPDGVYSEAFSCPAYQTENNLVDAYVHERLFGEKRFRGTITFWIKPSRWDAGTTKPRILFSLGEKGAFQPDPVYHYRVYQNMFGLFFFPKDYQVNNWMGTHLNQECQLVWFCDIDKTKRSEPSEYLFVNPIDQSWTKNWVHIGIAWDTNPAPKIWSYNCPNCKGLGKTAWKEGEIICHRCSGRGKITETQIMPGDVAAFFVNGQDVSKYIGASKEKYPPRIIEHINYSASNLLRLGERYNASFWNSSADATIDEVTIQIHEMVSKAREFIINEYRTGRYYKGEGAFTSGLIDFPLSQQKENETLQPEKTPIIPLDSPSRKRYSESSGRTCKCRADWTVYYPSDEERTASPIELQLFDVHDNPLSKVLSQISPSDFEIPLDGISSKQIKYKVFFREKRTDLSIPLLETPVFDDITITFIKSVPQVCESYLMP